MIKQKCWIIINWCGESPLSHSRNLVYLRKFVDHWKFERFWNWLVRVSLAKSQWVRLVKIIIRPSSLKGTDLLDRFHYLGNSLNRHHRLKIVKILKRISVHNRDRHENGSWMDAEFGSGDFRTQGLPRFLPDSGLCSKSLPHSNNHTPLVQIRNNPPQ